MSSCDIKQSNVTSPQITKTSHGCVWRRETDCICNVCSYPKKKTAASVAFGFSLWSIWAVNKCWMQYTDKSNLVIMTDVTAAVEGQRAWAIWRLGGRSVAPSLQPEGDWLPASGSQLPAGPDLFIPPLFLIFFLSSCLSSMLIHVLSLHVSVKGWKKNTSEFEKMSESHPVAHAAASLYHEYWIRAFPCKDF